MTLYHGTRKQDLPLHLGLCLTPDETAAEHYGSNVFELDVDFGGLRVIKVATGDRDNQDYAGDRDLSSYDADLIVYADEDTHGRQHETYRIVTAAALDAVRAAANR